MSRANKSNAKPAGQPGARTPPESDKVTELRRERVPLDVTKPPRDWRTARRTSAPETTGSPVHGSRTPVTPGAAAPPHAAPPPDRAAWPAPASGADAASHGVPELPERYHEDRAVLLVRDPYWIHAWWEVTEARLHRTRAELGEPGTIVLRLYDVSWIDWNGSNHHDARDFAVERGLGSWYLDVGRPDGSFCAEIGLRAGDGRFIPMLRTNVVRMPRDSMSPQLDEEWLALDDEYARMFQLSGGGAAGRSSGELLERRIRRDLAAGGASSFGVHRKPRL